MKPVWKGELQLDSFQFPVKVFSATQSKTINLNTFHSVCRSRLGEAKVCPLHGEIEKSEIVKGYPVSENHYVIIEDADFDQIELRSQTCLEIREFIHAAELNHLLIAKSYYLVPDGPPAREAYSVLKKALRQSAKVAITSIFLARKEYPAVIWCQSRVLILSALYLAEEVKPLNELDELKNLPRTRKAQLTEISALIEQKTRKFRHYRCRDEFARQFQARIQEKIKHEPGTLFQANSVKTTARKGMSKIEPIDSLSETGTK